MDDEPHIGEIVRLLDGRKGKLINSFQVHINGDNSSSSRVYCIQLENSRSVVKMARFQFDIIAECPGAPPSDSLCEDEEHVSFHTSNRGRWSPFSPVTRTISLSSDLEMNATLPNSPSISETNTTGETRPSSTSDNPSVTMNRDVQTNDDATNTINKQQHHGNKSNIVVVEETTPNTSSKNINMNSDVHDDNNGINANVKDSISENISTSNRGNKRNFVTIEDDDIDTYILEHENKNTARKTKSDINLLEEYLAHISEKRNIENIPPNELNTILCKFFMSIKKSDGTNYEPDSLRGMLASYQRYLKRNKYPFSLLESLEFSQLQEVFKRKKEELKQDGKGNRPKAADALTMDEITQLYEKKEISINRDPDTLLRTLWFNNSIQFGMRGVTEHYNMKWGDVQLLTDPNGNEYLEYSERNTKTRTGVNIEDRRRVKPKAWANKDQPDQCPVEAYKFYRDKRPTGFSHQDDPFYIAACTNTSKSSKWFKCQRVGPNKLSTFMKTMATNAGLDVTTRRLSNTSTRKYMIQTLNDHGVAPTKIMQISGHKNVQSINNYSHLTMGQQREISSILSKNPEPRMEEDVESTRNNTINIRPGSLGTQSSLGCIFGGNIYGGTFNVQIYK